MAGALHHRQGREVARAALLAVGRPGRRHVFIRHLAAAPEAGGRGAKIHGHEKETGQEGGEEGVQEDSEENRGESKKERKESADEKGRQEDSPQEDGQEALTPNFTGG